MGLGFYLLEVKPIYAGDKPVRHYHAELHSRTSYVEGVHSILGACDNVQALIFTFLVCDNVHALI